MTTTCSRCGDTHDRCTAHNRAGRPCRQSPEPGMTVCTSWRGRATSNLMEGASNPRKSGRPWDNESGPRGAGNTAGGLTHSSDLTREGLPMDGTRKRGLEPAPTATHGLPADLKAVYDGWPVRFRSKVALSAACWEWTACKDSKGYGRYGTTRARGTQGAHRMALELSGIDLPAGTPVDHLCRNTSCVRPDHLEIVTPAENVRRGAAANASGWCRSGRHEWTPENILTEPDGTRRCRPCRDEREKAYRPAKGPKSHCPQGHEYTPENTRIRRGSRECIECTRVRARADYWAKKASV